MKCHDPGHGYLLDEYDGDRMDSPILTFMKRTGDQYPGNIGAHSGTNCQDVLRALIDRVKYLDRQLPDPVNPVIISCLREAFISFEIRAARRHGLRITFHDVEVEKMPYCGRCGHIACYQHDSQQCISTHHKETQR